MLSYFKYGQFLLDNFAVLCQALGFNYHPAAHSIWLPVGISFYTFATMSYTLDVYLRRAAPAQSLLDYALFVTFFPHLVAGPIMRPTELVPQFAEPRQASPQQLRFGLALMTLGLFNKIVLADSFLSGAVDQVYDGGKMPGALDAWAGSLAFSGQIFCDFAGYSTTAIGAALCLGFFLPDNFRFPYAAVGFADFWRRWHITLSSGCVITSSFHSVAIDVVRAGPTSRSSSRCFWRACGMAPAGRLSPSADCMVCILGRSGRCGCASATIMPAR